MVHSISVRPVRKWIAATLLSSALAGCGSPAGSAPASLVVTPTSGLQTTEGGLQAMVYVSLDSRPSKDVTVPVATTDTTEGTITTTSLVFTRDNWNAPQAVVVTGVDDHVADGTQTYSLAFGPSTSGDRDFVDLSGSVDLRNVDDETPGVLVSAPAGDVTEAGTTTTLTVVLSSEPTADVVLTVASDDTGEGTIAPSTLRFTALDWNAPQTVTVTGVDDDFIDGTQTFHVAVTAIASSDAGYASLALPSPVSVRTVDDDSAGFLLATVDATSGEDGDTASFTVALTARPSADVTITLGTSGAGEGEVTSPTTLIFTPSDYATPQTVTVTGRNDDLADGTQPYQISVAVGSTTDTDYAALAAGSVGLGNVDDDSAGILVSAATGHTTEAGGTATFTIRLASEPYGDVTVAFDTDDPGEGTVDKTSVTFTTTDWNVAQTVTLTGVNDAIDDGDQPYQIAFSDVTSTDTAYDAMLPANVVVTNDDDDTRGVHVSAISGPTTEKGGTATFTVVLDTEPTADVELTFGSSDTTEGTTDVNMLVFTSTDWYLPKTVTVTGVDDTIVDGDIAYTIDFDPVSSLDPVYDGLTVASVAVVNVDDKEICYCPWAGETFEDGVADGFTQLTQTMAVTNATAANGTTRSLTVTGGSTGHLNGVYLQAPTCQTTRFSAWVRPQAGTAAHNYIVLGDDSVTANNCILFFYAQGSSSTFRLVSSSTATAAYTPDVWVHVVFEIDWATKTVNASVDGVPFATGLPFRSSTQNQLTRIHLYNYNSAVGTYDEIEMQTACP